MKAKDIVMNLEPLMEISFSQGILTAIRCIEGFPLVQPDADSITLFKPFYHVEKEVLENMKAFWGIK